MEKKVTTHITKGILIALILFVVDLIGGFTHLKYTAPSYGWVSTILLLIAIIWATSNYGNQLNNNVTFGNLFAFGFKTSAVVACITLIFALLSIFLIFPDSKDLYLEQARKRMEEKGNIPDETINQALEMTKKMFLPFAIAGVILGTLIVGAIGALIGAAITKKKPQTPFDKQP
jgi:Protein of unknown function (DUF4199)